MQWISELKSDVKFKANKFENEMLIWNFEDLSVCLLGLHITNTEVFLLHIHI